jgi:hypothetical protein
MEYWYNLTAIDGSNLLTFTQSINRDLMQNALGILFLIMIWAIVYINLMINSPQENNAANLSITTFIIAVISVPLFILDLVPNYMPYFCWGMFALFVSVWVLHK